MRIVFVGDINFGRSLAREYLFAGRGAEIFAGVRDSLCAADIAIGNLESIILDRGRYAGEVSRLLRQPARDASRLQRIDISMARALCLLIRGGASAVRGDRAGLSGRALSPSARSVCMPPSMLRGAGWSRGARAPTFILASAAAILALASCGGQDVPARGQPPGRVQEQVPPPEPSGLIAFVSDRDGNSEIYVMSADGSGFRNLTNHPADDGEPAWSPDGASLAFVSNRDGNSEIYVMNADGSHLRNLTNSRADDRSPVWSPDGTRLAFERYVSEEVQGDEGQPSTSVSVAVHVMNADGSQSRKLTNRTDPDDRPSWSPDGTRIAFEGSDLIEYEDGPPGHERRIYVIDADGSGLRRLSNRPAGGTRPAWSPVGDRLVFVSNWEILVMNPDGTGLMILTNRQSITPADDHTPAWSPDGGRLALVSYDNREIFVMNADGSGLRNLTNHPAFEVQPAWSPDGTRLAFVSNRDGNNEIYVVNADGSGLARLTNHAGSDEHPVWSPGSHRPTASATPPTGDTRP